MSESTTLSGNEDVEVQSDEQEVTTVDQDVEQVETNVDDYEKAWESIDVNEPPAEIFGETTVQETSEEPVSEESEHVEPNTEGLVITNPVLKFKGKEIPIDSADEMIALAQKGFRLESEMSKIKPLRPLIKIIESAGLTAEDVQALADMKSGKKEALNYLKRTAGIEDEELPFGSGLFEDKKEDTKDYKPDIPVDDPVASVFNRITEEDPELAGKVSKVYDDIDDEFKAEVYNPNVFPMFVSSIASGEFDTVYPIAVKTKMMNPALSWLEAYAMAGNQGNQSKQDKVVPPADTSIPKNKDTGRNVKEMNYDSAYDLSLEELEKRLFVS
jgi:hypothetical protein